MKSKIRCLLRRGFILGSVFAILVSCNLAHAAYSGYVKIPDIPGESLRVGHEEEIEVYGVHLEISVKDSGGRIRNAADFSPITFRKRVDIATPRLMSAVASGRSFPEVELFVLLPSADGSHLVMRLELENVIFDRIEVEGDFAEDFLSEEFSLNYEKVTFEYIVLNEDHSTGETVEFSWDVEGNVAN